MSTRIQFLKDQFDQSRDVLDRIVGQVPDEKWFHSVGQPQSNIAWQVGHLIVATNFHGVSLMAGRDTAILKNISFDLYRQYCVGLGSKDRVLQEGLITPEKMREELAYIQAVSIEKLLTLSEEMLDQPYEPSPFKIPIAKTKYEVLSWMFKHEAWHCAEMELIKLNLDLGFKWQ